MKRKVSLKKYLSALIITILIFSLGSIFGIYLEGERFSYSEAINLEQKIELSSLQMQQLFISTLNPDLKCDGLTKLFESSLSHLDNSMNNMIDFQKKASFDQEKFNLNLREYYLTEIRYLLLSKQIKEKCPSESVEIIYFYSDNKLNVQGFILDSIKKEFGRNVLIFSFNSDFKQEPMIEVLLTSYNVSQFPAVIIGKTKFEGDTVKSELINEICNHLTNHPKCK